MARYRYNEHVDLELHVQFKEPLWAAQNGTVWRLPEHKASMVFNSTDKTRTVAEVWALYTYLAWPYDKKGVVRGLL